MPACALAAQRRKRLIVLVPMNGRIKPAMTDQGGWCCLVDPHIHRPSGLRIKSAMTVCRARPSRPVDSRLRGNDGRFCKGLHQGRGGIGGWFVLLLPRHPAAPLDCGSSLQRACATVVASRYSAWRVPALWILDQVRNDALSCTAGHGLWIDESWMMLFEHLGFQSKGVATL